jgi:hypothetical protein
VKGVGKNTRFLSLGIVYGRDRFVPRPLTPEILPISKGHTGLGVEVQKLIFANYGDKKDKISGYFIMGDSVDATTSATTPAAPADYFNHLSVIKIDWQIKDIVFAAKAGKLIGLKTTWVNGVPRPMAIWERMTRTAIVRRLILLLKTEKATFCLVVRSYRSMPTVLIVSKLWSLCG